MLCEKMCPVLRTKGKFFKLSPWFSLKLDDVTNMTNNGKVKPSLRIVNQIQTVKIDSLTDKEVRTC